MRDDDYTFATYRGHNHALARGTPMGPLYAELFGRANGLLGGKGGSMHITDVDHHMMGSYAIVGAHLPIALGAAWSAQYRKSGQVAVCFFGDGTTNIGAFHEALNMAAVWKAPVVFVCENNQYMEYTPIGAVTAVEHPAADRAAAYGLESILIDGNDAEEVYADGPAGHRTGTERRRAVARRGRDVPPWRAPRADPGKYRPDDEVAAWLAKDPIPGSEPGSSSRRSGGGRSTRSSGGQGGRGRGRGRGEGRGSRRPDVLETQVWADGGSLVAELTYREAVAAGIAQEMERDELCRVHRRGRRRGRRRVQDDRGPARHIRPRTASATRRSASRRSSVP